MGRYIWPNSSLPRTTALITAMNAGRRVVSPLKLSRTILPVGVKVYFVPHIF